MVGDNIDIETEFAPEHRVEARWTKAVLSQGYTIVPGLLINSQSKLGITPEEMNVILHLAYHWRTAGTNPFPTKRRIAALMGKSEKQIQRYFRSLEDKALVHRQKRMNPVRGQMSNSYDLSGLIIRLRELAAEEAALKRAAKRVES